MTEEEDTILWDWSIPSTRLQFQNHHAVGRHRERETGFDAAQCRGDGHDVARAADGIGVFRAGRQRDDRGLRFQRGDAFDLDG